MTLEVLREQLAGCGKDVPALDLLLQACHLLLQGPAAHSLIATEALAMHLRQELAGSDVETLSEGGLTTRLGDR